MPNNDLDNVIDTVEKIDVKIKEKVAKPAMYKVLLHNDDITDGLFVIGILNKIFNKSTQEAISIATKVHTSGMPEVVAIYPKNIAKEKVEKTEILARQNNFPLKFSYEKDVGES